MIKAIGCVDRKGLMGKGGTIPWMGILPNDMKYFVRMTKKAIVIVGHKTLVDCLKQPLKGRTNVVISRDPNLRIEGCAIAHSVEAAIAYARGISLTQDDIWVIGGGEIYRQALDMVDELHLTVIDHEFEGDTYFPEWSKDDWELISSTEFLADENNAYDHRFEVWKRKNIIEEEEKENDS